MPFSTALNNDVASKCAQHRRYHELCGHVYANINMRYVDLIKKMIGNRLLKYLDGTFEGALGALSDLKSSLELTLQSFSYGGSNVLAEGRSIARRQTNFAKLKMQARRTGWDVEKYRKAGHFHLTNESLRDNRNIIEYEDEIEGSQLYYSKLLSQI